MAAHSPPIRTAHPFSRIIAFDWYDGPVKGLARLSTSDDACVFAMLDGDGRLETRVFALYRIPVADFESCFDALSKIETPRNSLWVPTNATAAVDVGRWLKTEPQHAIAVVAANRFLENILVYRAIAPGEVVNRAEWDLDDGAATCEWMTELFGIPQPS